MRRESVLIMVTWSNFWIFAIMAVLLWAAGAYFAWRGIAPTGMGGGKLSLLGEERTASGSQRQRQRKSIWPFIMTILGLGVFFSFIVGLWVSLERPPLRTMGETRLWYSLFLPTAGQKSITRHSCRHCRVSGLHHTLSCTCLPMRCWVLPPWSQYISSG